MTKVKELPPEITAIDNLARQYADAQMDLDQLTNDMKVEIDAVVRRRWPDVKRATTRAAERHDALNTAVAAAQGAFVTPKTRLLHGVRCGWQKAQDKIEVPNEQNTIALIKDEFPKLKGVLISTTEELVKGALKQLEDDQLKTIACRRVPGKDEPTVKLADTDLDKVVAALLKNAIEKVEAS